MKKGFTLVELIIVIAIVAILAGAIFVAIDPARRLHEARNAIRASDISSVLDALKKYQVDNEGEHFEELLYINVGDVYVIGSDAVGCDTTCGAQSTQSECLDLLEIAKNYLGKVPYDPKDGSEENTDYYIYLDASSALVVGACDPEGEGAGGGGVAPVIEAIR